MLIGFISADIVGTVNLLVFSKSNAETSAPRNNHHKERVKTQNKNKLFFFIPSMLVSCKISTTLFLYILI